MQPPLEYRGQSQLKKNEFIFYLQTSQVYLLLSKRFFKQVFEGSVQF